MNKCDYDTWEYVKYTGSNTHVTPRISVMSTQWQFACIRIILNTVSASKDFKRRWLNISESKKLLRSMLKLRVSNNFFLKLPDVNKSCVYIVILREVKCSIFFSVNFC